MQGADLAQPLRYRNDVQMKKDPAALFGVSAPVSGAKPPAVCEIRLTI